MGTEKKLEVKNLSFAYHNQKAIFDDVSFSLCASEVFVILGANGAGKSTLLNCIAGILPPQSGEILVKGANLHTLSVGGLARVMGYVPQISVPAFSYKVRDYIVMGRAPHMGLLKVPGDEEYAMADEIMQYMGISHLAEKAYDQISGGERQQVQIARVLIQKTEIILLDEPTNHLDYGNQLKVIRQISRLARDSGRAVLMTSHMPDHALLLDSKVGILDNAGHMTVGRPEKVVSEAALRQLYHTDLHLIYIEQLGRYACVSGRLDRASHIDEAEIETQTKSYITYD